MQRIPAKHLNGPLYFRLAGREELDFNSYFICLQYLKPLLEDSDFKSSTAGFYINYIADPSVNAPNGSTRITYLSVDNPKTIAAVDAFVKKNADKIELFTADGAYKNKTAELAESDPDRLRFWNSLNDSTHIGLDLLDALGPIGTHAVMYHYGTICLPQGIMPKDFLEPFFRRHSKYYQELEKEGLSEEYWTDLTRWSERDLPLHFPCNMLLGPDEHAFKRLLPTIGTRRPQLT